MTKERVASFAPDDFRRNARNYQEPYLSRNLALADFLKQIGARHGVTAGVVAIAWTLANPAITAAIVGGRSPEQAEQCLAGGKIPPSPTTSCRRSPPTSTPTQHLRARADFLGVVRGLCAHVRSLKENGAGQQNLPLDRNRKSALGYLFPQQLLKGATNVPSHQ